jgi:hypothetical protein
MRNSKRPLAGICVLVPEPLGSHALPFQLGVGENSSEAREKHAGLFGVFRETFAKFFG